MNPLVSHKEIVAEHLWTLSWSWAGFLEVHLSPIAMLGAYAQTNQANEKNEPGNEALLKYQ